ncbi:MAG TPA: MOSC domain-containing protein [Acidocella sp.]|jgi:uncharacterized protein YcbX|uniref:MOSC domain-containing protein n=1 Tax=Acidocella sp. TaxID=50710 RepID=UPI002CF5CBA1|nr:MOSC domain-containing protein [Acidocella sp.]HVE23305.1 MOSC domain-containing protein [Acidocella sp.]
MHIESLYRYPVKGLSPETLNGAHLAPGRCLPWDRAFALAQGDAAFDPENPAWVQKSHFMCLARNAKIANLKSCFDDAARRLVVTAPEGQRLEADPFTPAGQDALTAFLTRYLGAEARYGANGKAPRFHHFPNHSFCDHKTQVISLIGRGSLAALEAAAGATRDKRRFRANIYIENIEPWAEFAWMGRHIRVGETVLEVQEPIDRCAATSVNPDTAERDANPVKELQQHFGHIELGVFAAVVQGGEIRPGDEIALLG